MALPPRSGYSTLPSTPLDNPVTTTVGELDQSSFVSNALTQTTELNPLKYPSEAKLLQGYLEGSRIVVTYFKYVEQRSDIVSSVVDSSMVVHPNHTPYERINQFEITLPEAISFNWDDEKAIANLTGSGILYAGFNPTKNDIFIYEIGDGRMGKFIVTNAVPNSWRDGRTYTINFKVDSIVDQEAFTNLTNRVVRTLTFDKQTYLSGNNNLLTSDNYTLLNTVRHYMNLLIKDFHRAFYVKSINTYMHPNGYYDPYLVEYIKSKVTFAVVGCCPQQVYSKVRDTHDYTVWGYLDDPERITITGLKSYYRLYIQLAGSRSAYIPDLLNQSVLSIVDDPLPTDPPDNFLFGNYVFSSAFYTGQEASMTELEKIVYHSIVSREVSNPTDFVLNFLKSYNTLDRETFFYYGPLYLHICGVISMMLTHPRSRSNLL